MEPGDALPELKVTPDKHLTVRYAGASGDFNPIHIDEELARSVGLPGRILHGLWTMAQVARAVTEAGGGPEALRRLEVQFRGMGLPEHEITVTASVKEVGEDGTRVIAAQAEQGGKKIIRNARAELAPRGRLITSAGCSRPARSSCSPRSIDGFAATGQPVGSKALAADPDVDLGPVHRPQRARGPGGAGPARPPAHLGRPRADGRGLPLLRRPPARGAPRRRARRAAPRMELTLGRREVDEAMRQTTETLSQLTNLLAIVSAPPIATTTIRHVEVLLLQPQVLMVVIITSTGGVSKRVFTFERPVDPGLADWAASYLNERLVGRDLGARTLRARLTDPGLSPTERAFLEQLTPAFTQLAETAENTLYVDGAARLLAEHRFQDVSQLNALLEMLERRVSLLAVLSTALGERDLYVRIGGENAVPALHSLSLVAANYGLPQRNLGTVSVIGPTRMDYGDAIGAVREAAGLLSRFVEDVYDAD